MAALADVHRFTTAKAVAVVKMLTGSTGRIP